MGRGDDIIEGFTLCFTGISGSGKSTLAEALAEYLLRKGINVQVIDGDILREQLGHLFGYTHEERMKNSRVVRVLAKYLNINHINVIVAIVAPYEEMRRQLRDFIGSNYIEVYVQCPVEECARRDVKGYYGKQLAGKLENLNGVDDMYEVPQDSDIIINTKEESIEESLKKIVKYLEENDLCHINM